VTKLKHEGDKQLVKNLFIAGLAIWAILFSLVGFFHSDVAVAFAIFTPIVVATFVVVLVSGVLLKRFLLTLRERRESEEKSHRHELGRLFDKLIRQGNKSIPTFLNWLEEGDAELQALAVKGLGVLKAKEAVEPLLALLKNAHPELKAQVLWALGEIRDRRAMPAIVPHLGDFTETGKGTVSHFAAEALRKLKFKSVANSFMTAFNSSNDDELSQSLKKLRKYCQSDLLVQAFVKALDAPDVTKAINAAKALEKLFAFSALPILREKAKTASDERLKDACQRVVRQLELVMTLPSPALPTSLDTSTLPIPATPTKINPETLPRAVDQSLQSDQNEH